MTEVATCQFGSGAMRAVRFTKSMHTFEHCEAKKYVCKDCATSCSTDRWKALGPWAVQHPTCPTSSKFHPAQSEPGAPAKTMRIILCVSSAHDEA